MSNRKLAVIALALLVIASPLGVAVAVAQAFGTAPTTGATAYFQSIFLGGDVGTLIVWLVIVGMAWGMWHMTHNIWAGIIPAVIFLVIYYRSPVIGPALMAALSSGTGVAAP